MQVRQNPRSHPPMPIDQNQDQNHTTELEPEHWKPVPHYPAYEVSTHARVRRTRSAQGTRAGKLISPTEATGKVHLGRLGSSSKEGHGSVTWHIDLATLLLLAFKGQPTSPSAKPHFKDGKPSNLNLSNLCWSEPNSYYHRRKLAHLLHTSAPTSMPKNAGRPVKPLTQLIEEYRQIMRAIPHYDEPPITVADLLAKLRADEDEQGTYQYTKQTLYKRLKELEHIPELPRIRSVLTNAVSGLDTNTQSDVSLPPGRPGKGYTWASGVTPVVTRDFSDLSDLSESNPYGQTDDEDDYDPLYTAAMAAPPPLKPGELTDKDKMRQRRGLPLSKAGVLALAVRASLASEEEDEGTNKVQTQIHKEREALGKEPEVGATVTTASKPRFRIRT